MIELSDAWWLGILLWEVFTRGFVPYDLLQSDEMVAAQVCGGGRLDQPAGCPNTVYGVMHACWAQGPQERPSFATLTAWLQGIARGEDLRPRAPAARGACVTQVRHLHVGAEGGGGAALPPVHYVRAVLPARLRLPHLPPAHRACLRARGDPLRHLCRRGFGSYRGAASTVGGGWTSS